MADEQASSKGAFTTPTVMPTGEKVTQCMVSRELAMQFGGRVAVSGPMRIEVESETNRAEGLTLDGGKSWIWTKVTASDGQTINWVTHEQ